MFGGGWNLSVFNHGGSILGLLNDTDFAENYE
jgi:hypothetical protein